jgi:hypothetical protein
VWENRSSSTRRRIAAVTAALARREKGDGTLMEIARSYAVSHSTISLL